MRNTPAQRRTVEKTAALLSACEVLLLELPSEQITATMICERAGVTRTSMYHFFPSKVDVYDALAHRYHEALRERIVSSFPAGAQHDYGEAWHGVIAVYRRYFEEHPAAMVLLLGKRGVRQALYPNDEIDEVLARQVHALMISRTDLPQHADSLLPGPDLFRYMLDVLASLFSTSVRREGGISASAVDLAQRATKELLWSALASSKPDL